MRALTKPIITVFLFAILIFVFDSCKRNCPPEVKTTAVSQITTTTAVSGGEVTNDCGSDVIARGVCWNTTGQPDITDSKTTDGSGTGSFTSTLTQLKANTQYFVRAYATNEAGTGYGDQVTFTSGSVSTGTVTTKIAEQITTTTAVTGGVITSDGGNTITARGVCWTTQSTTSPTINDNHTTDTGTDSFTSTLEGLQPGTTYFIRAYVTNSAGTSYGEKLVFTTDALDIDGNAYDVVHIGNQIWFAENLKTTRLNDGTDISLTPGNENWAALTTPGYCWFNNSNNNRDVYGGLYNWYAVNTGKLCPDGWHVPSG